MVGRSQHRPAAIALELRKGRARYVVRAASALLNVFSQADAGTINLMESEFAATI